MIIYKASKLEFLKDVAKNDICDILKENLQMKMNIKPSPSEIRSWSNSLSRFANFLSAYNLPENLGISLEYKVPTTSNRVDLILSGLKKKDKKVVILIELKQWQEAFLVPEKDGIVKTYIGRGINEVVHPSYQVLSYKNLLQDFCVACDNKNIDLVACAYLHNYDKKPNEELLNNHYSKYINEAPLFFKKDSDDLARYINENIVIGDNATAIEEIEYSEKRPSKSLQKLLYTTIKGNKDFTLIDSQKTVYETIIHWVKVAKDDNKKRCIIVDGKPGTGKTVVAMNALSKITNSGLMVKYVTRNYAVRDVFAEILNNGTGEKDRLTKTRIKELMSSSGSFIESIENEFSCLIVDEAHRLNEKTQQRANADNQIKEIIKASKVSVFFLDDRQLVTSRDIGLRENIIGIATDLIGKVNIYTYELESQFRLNGSDNYADWLIDILYEGGNKYILNESTNYDFKIFDDISEFRKMIESKNKNNKARIVASYNWDWVSKYDTDAYDIVIGKERWKWNLFSDKTWAISKSSIKEVGCIYTCQGLEFDYCGVIIGDYLDVIDGKLVTLPHKVPSSDRSAFNGIKTKLFKNDPYALELADKLIRNQFYVLLSRGIKGTYVYFTNSRVKKYFLDRIDLKQT